MRNTSSSVPNAADPKALAAELLQRAHNRDGLPEITAGAILLLVAGLLYMQVVIPPGQPGHQSAAYLFTFGLPVLCIGAPWVLKQVRRRYLMDRFGYVEYKPVNRTRAGASVVVAAVAAAVMMGVVVGGSQVDAWLLAGTGVMAGALAVLSGRLPRFIGLGALMAVTGMWLALSGISLERGLPILFGASGALALISGCIVFVRFMRQPVEASE